MLNTNHYKVNVFKLQKKPQKQMQQCKNIQNPLLKQLIVFNYKKHICN